MNFDTDTFAAVDIRANNTNIDVPVPNLIGKLRGLAAGGPSRRPSFTFTSTISGECNGAAVNPSLKDGDGLAGPIWRPISALGSDPETRCKVSGTVHATVKRVGATTTFPIR